MITALQAETMTLCLYLRADHLHYEIYAGIEHLSPDSLGQGDYVYDKQLPPGEALAEAIYNTALLVLPYAKVRVYHTPQRCHLVPEELYTESDCWLSCVEHLSVSAVSGQVSASIYAPTAYPLPESGQMLVGVLPSEVMQFFGRQYLNVEYIPEYAPWLVPSIEEARRAGRGQMLIYLDALGVSLAYCTDRQVDFLNRYDYVSPWQEATKEGEVLYYLSLVLETLGLDYPSVAVQVRTDEAGEMQLAASLLRLLRPETVAPEV